MITFEQALEFEIQRAREEAVRKANKNDELWQLIDNSNKHYNRWLNKKGGFIECFFKNENPNRQRYLQTWKSGVACVVGNLPKGYSRRSVSYDYKNKD